MNLTKRISIFALFIFSLIIGLLFNENSSGGAKIDYIYLLPYIEKFSTSFLDGLDYFFNNSATIIHSPVHYILTGYLYKITQSFFVIKIFYILISSLLPLVFYFILKNKYKINDTYIFLFSLIIFLSPYFRSSAIWMLGDNLSLLFFSLSILFYLKTKNSNEININYFFCLLFLILCCYIRYYYCLFAFFFFYEFYLKLEIKKIFYLIIFSIFLSLPVFFYFYFIIINKNFLITASYYAKINYPGNFLQVLSILLFYLLPFFISEILNIYKYYRNNLSRLIILAIPIIFILLIDNIFKIDLINFYNHGGGVFRKFFEILNLNLEIFICITSFMALVILDYYFKNYLKFNYFLLILLILCFPMYTIFQKYFDPLFYLFFFGLIKSDYFENLINNRTGSLSIIYCYFTLFLFFSNYYYFKINLY